MIFEVGGRLEILKERALPVWTKRQCQLVPSHQDHHRPQRCNAIYLF